MIKRFVVLFLMIAMLLSGFSVVRAGQYYSAEEAERVIDPLERYTVKEEVKGFFAKIRAMLKPLNEKTRHWWVSYLKPKMQRWIENIKARLKQWIEEEKAELQNKFWRSTKEFFK